MITLTRNHLFCSSSGNYGRLGKLSRYLCEATRQSTCTIPKCWGLDNWEQSVEECYLLGDTAYILYQPLPRHYYPQLGQWSSEPRGDEKKHKDYLWQGGVWTGLWKVEVLVETSPKTQDYLHGCALHNMWTSFLGSITNALHAFFFVLHVCFETSDLMIAKHRETSESKALF